ncbi:MAG: CBS domain-containing protein [Candidatus Bathyarchaeota archaeon]|nr:CBS domain-containing protein [Candidatus Bathyarchaeota archaeon]
MTKTLEEIGRTEISTLLDKRLVIFTPEESVSRVLGELERTGRYEAAVQAGDKVGLITLRHLLNVTQPENTKLVHLWKPLTQVTPDSIVTGVAAELIRINERALPVVEGKKPVGIISQLDIVKAMAECPELGNVPAKELAKKPVTSMDAKEAIAKARSTMLDKGISHIPVTRAGKLVGMVTAQDLILIFLQPQGRGKLGEKPSENTTKYKGELGGIMDEQPLTVSVEASALEVARGLRDRKKSACLLTDAQGTIQGIITPRELLALIARRPAAKELPIQIIGLKKEDFFDQAEAEAKVDRVIKKAMNIHPDIDEVSIVIKRASEKGHGRYEMTARVISPTEQINAHGEGHDMLQTFEDMLNKLESELMKTKTGPHTARRSEHGKPSEIEAENREAEHEKEHEGEETEKEEDEAEDKDEELEDYKD